MSESTGSAENLETSGQEDKSQDKVAYATYQRTLSEAKKAKAERDALLAEKQLMVESKMKEQNEWKALAEAKEKEANDFKTKYDEVQQNIVGAMKRSAVLKHIGGNLKHSDYENFINLDKVAFNPEERKVDETSAKTVAAEFLKEHSALVDFKTGRMPNEAAGSSSRVGKNPSDMTPDELRAELSKFNKL